MASQEFAPEESKSQKKVTVYGTRGEKNATFETNAADWNELKQDLLKNGVNPEGMKAIIGETQEEMKEDIQEIKENEISLFLTPVRVKSGEAA